MQLCCSLFQQYITISAHYTCSQILPTMCSELLEVCTIYKCKNSLKKQYDIFILILLALSAFMFCIILRKLIVIGLETNEKMRERDFQQCGNTVVCAISKGSDQPAHMGSLVRGFASCLNNLTSKLLNAHHLEFLSIRRGCTGLSESTLV